MKLKSTRIIHTPKRRCQQRFSKLQRFILTTATRAEDLEIKPYEIYRGFYGLESGRIPGARWDWRYPTGAAYMAVYRSTRALKEKGFAKQTRTRGRVYLTPEGEEKARALLLTSMAINNKDKRLKAEDVNNKKPGIRQPYIGNNS